jgi:hypothetical protein
MNTQKLKSPTKKQIFMATLLAEFVVGVAAGIVHPVLGIAIDAAIITSHIVTYQDKKDNNETSQ